MINLFQFAASDASCGYLISIFGTMNGVICNPLASTTSSALGPIFQTFNSVILAVGALLIVYTTVVGVMMTAQEGEFMGKKWNNIWIPIRMVLGVACLVPLGGGGYSLIQYVMMWVLVQGIGAADTLWATALASVKATGSLFAQPTIPSSGATATMGQLFASLTCDATTRLSYKDPTGEINYYCQGSSTGICSPNSQLNVADAKCDGKYCTLPMGAGGQCGTLSWCDSSAGGAACSNKNSGSLGCSACTTQNTTLQSLIPALYSIAQQFAQFDYFYRQFIKQSSTNSSNPDWSFIYSYCASQSYSQANCCVPNNNNSIMFGAPTSGSCSTTTAMGANPTSGSASGPSGTSGNSGNSNSPCLYGQLPAMNSGSSCNNPQNASDDAVTGVYWPAITAWLATQGSVTEQVGTNGDFIDGATSTYINAISNAATAWVTQENANPNSTSNSTLSNLSGSGWVMAGTAYYYLAGMNNNNLSQANVTFAMNGKTPSSSANYRNNYNAAQTLVNDVVAGGAAPGGLTSVQGLGASGSTVSNTMTGVNNSFSTNISGAAQTNPLSQLQSAGMGMIISAEALFVTFLAVTVILAAAGFIDVEVLGTGGLDPAGPIANLLYLVFVPMVFALLGFLITIGGLLGVYVPLIPYIVFTFGVIGWLLAVIETMVAGPLVALGIISPSGQHELLGKAEPALMLLFNVFLRPSLMIFGLMAAIYLASVVVKMINSAFWGVAQSIGGLGDPLTSILFLCAYVMLIVSALNKCFAAISIIPQQVMSWIGGHGQPGGAAGEAGEALSETKGGISQGGAQAKGGMEGTQKAGMEAGVSAAPEARANRAENNLKKGGYKAKNV